MISYVVLESNSPKLDMRTLDLQALGRWIESGTEVRWDRDGEHRRIPHPVLLDLYRTYTDGLKLIDAQRLGEIFAASCGIAWEQTEPLEESREVKVALHPGPGVAHAAGNSRGDDSPAY